ncbi:MerR family transcriptional regulator, partial [Bacillus safensis]
MINDVQKTFFTGEFAKLFDVKKDTLLYYDKIDLFKPAGVH